MLLWWMRSLGACPCIPEFSKTTNTVLCLRSIWLDSRAAILYVAAFSIMTLTAQSILARRSNSLATKPATLSVRPAGHLSLLYAHFLQYGSFTIATFKVLRVLSTSALLVVTVVGLARRNVGFHPVILLEVPALVRYILPSGCSWSLTWLSHMLQYLLF